MGMRIDAQTIGVPGHVNAFRLIFNSPQTSIINLGYLELSLYPIGHAYRIPLLGSCLPRRDFGGGPSGVASRARLVVPPELPPEQGLWRGPLDGWLPSKVEGRVPRVASRARARLGVGRGLGPEKGS